MPHLIKKQKYYYFKKILNFFAEQSTPSYHNIYWWNIKNQFLRKTGLEIGQQVVIDKNFFILNGCENNLNIGDYTVVNMNCKVMAYNNIFIGKFCMIGAEVSFANGGHNINNYESYSSKIDIGNGVWIGYRATIIAKEKGIKIGNNVIVGAGSLVINDIPDNAIVGGIPAKVIGYRNLPDKIRHIGNIYYDPINFNLRDEDDI